MLKIGIASIVFSLFLSGCFAPSAGKDFTFEAKHEQGLVAIRNPPPPIRSPLGHMEYFKLNYQEKTLGEHIRVCDTCWYSIDMFDLDDGKNKYKLFYLKPGIYSISVLNAFGIWGRANLVHKFCLDSPAFKVEAGRVNLINLGLPENSQLRSLKSALQNKTNIQAPVSISKILSTISFDCDLKSGKWVYEPGHHPFQINSK